MHIINRPFPGGPYLLFLQYMTKISPSLFSTMSEDLLQIRDNFPPLLPLCCTITKMLFICCRLVEDMWCIKDYTPLKSYDMASGD